MSRRELIRDIVAGKPTHRSGFWLGNPHHKTWPIILKHLGVKNHEQARQMLNDDIRWICPQFYSTAYNHPKGKMMFPFMLDIKGMDTGRRVFANVEDPAELDDYEFPNPAYLNFDRCLADLENAGDVYRLSGMWCSFYHNLMDYFGMDNYMMKMHTHPEVVEAVTEKVCQFYLDANELFFKQAGDLVDGFFFGNDFGTQQNLIVSPKHFDRFIAPWFKKFTDQGKKFGLQIFLHSCGSIHGVIDRLIDMGVDCLHPLQANAGNMDAATLSKDFKGKLIFFGGIDTQDLLVNATPGQVKEEVARVKKLLGPRMIISPSHEAVLPDIPPENIVAMAEADRS